MKIASTSILLTCLLGSVCGCSHNDGNSQAASTSNPEPHTTQKPGSLKPKSPVYSIGSLTFGENGDSNNYVLLLPDLNLASAQLSLDQGREFPGQGDIATHDGSLLVASGDAPSISRFEVLADNTLSIEHDENGEEKIVDFTNYGIASAAFWNNRIVAANKAYMVNGASQLIVWNPKEMTLGGIIDLPKLETRKGLQLTPGLADRASIVHDGKFYLPLYWTDESYAQRSEDSVIVVVDIETDTVLKTISAVCPGLDHATEDDAGQLHFSNWTGGVGTYYVLGTAQNCIATLDPKTDVVTTKTFASITGGHEGAAFMYTGNGRFVLSVLDEVRAEIDKADDPFTPLGGLNWQLWSYDVATAKAGPIAAVEWNSGAIVHTQVDDQFYSMVPGADYKSTRVYTLNDTGAEPAFAIDGWSFRLFAVR